MSVLCRSGAQPCRSALLLPSFIPFGLICGIDLEPIAGKPGVRGYDAGKNVNGRKRHLLVDTLGLLLRIKVTGAEVSDQAGALRLLALCHGACKKLRRIWVDGAYRGDLLTNLALSLGLHWTTVLRPAGAQSFV